jgi:hypothetical protein
MNVRKVILWSKTLSSEALMLSAALVAVALLVSCGDDDCPACPKPEEEVEPDYHVLYSYAFVSETDTRRLVHEYSLKTGALVRMHHYNDVFPFNDAVFSEDGSLTYYTRMFGDFDDESKFKCTWITNTRTGDTLALSYGNGGESVELSTDGEFLLVSRSSRLTLFSLPDLRELYVDSLTVGGEMGNAVFHPLSNKFYFHRGDYNGIQVATYGSEGVTSITAYRTFNLEGDVINPVWESVSPDGKYLILDAGRRLGTAYFQVRDTDSLAVIFEAQYEGWRLHLDHAWHTDGVRVFMPYLGGFDFPGIGGIDVYDITTKVLQPYLTADEVKLDDEFLGPGSISFTPEGDKMVIMDGKGALASGGSILVLDMATRLVTRRIDMPYYAYPSALALIPIDWEKEKEK